MPLLDLDNAAKEPTLPPLITPLLLTLETVSINHAVALFPSPLTIPEESTSLLEALELNHLVILLLLILTMKTTTFASPLKTELDPLILLKELLLIMEIVALSASGLVILPLLLRMLRLPTGSSPLFPSLLLLPPLLL